MTKTDSPDAPDASSLEQKLAYTFRDRHLLELLVNIGDIAVAGLFHRRLDQATELHSREIRRRRGVACDLVFQPADLVVLALDRRNHLVAVPENLEPELDLVLHLVEHIGESLVGRLEESKHIVL